VVRRNERKIRHKLYQGIQTDGAADDTRNQGNGKSNEPLLLEGGRGGGRHGGTRRRSNERWVMNWCLYMGDIFNNTALCAHITCSWNTDVKKDNHREGFTTGRCYKIMSVTRDNDGAKLRGKTIGFFKAMTPTTYIVLY
jgi:hypothetical protein